MAKRCDQCGKILPNDSIRYCTGCGKMVASSRPAKRSTSDGPPDWMKQLETSLTGNRSNRPLRELHVKVWEEEETVHSNVPESEVHSVGDEIDVVDDLPTSPLMVAHSPQIKASTQTNSSLHDVGIDEEDDAEELPTNPLLASQPHHASLSGISSSTATAFGNEIKSHDQLEDIATRPYVAQPHTISREIEKPVYQQGQATEVSNGSKYSPVMQGPMTPMPLPQPQFVPAQQPVRQTPPVSMPVPPLARTKKNKSKRLVIVFGLLSILLLGGVIAWVIVTQPFAVPQITNTTQSFKDTSLGVALQYPQHWVVVVNNQNGTIRFYDDNHTDQVNIAVVVAGNQGMNLYMSKTVSLLGMTGQKAQTQLSFAGATWQQIQGSVLQNGANYTATLLVTMHGDHYYTILQLAPSSTYPLEEQLVFSKLRSSFQF